MLSSRFKEGCEAVLTSKRQRGLVGVRRHQNVREDTAAVQRIEWRQHR